MDDTHLILTIAVARRAGHLSGVVTRDDGARREFTGRLGLMGAIDALVDDGAAEAPDARDPKETIR